MLLAAIQQGYTIPTINYIGSLTASSASVASSGFDFGTSTGSKKLVVVTIAIANSSVNVSSVTAGGVSLSLQQAFDTGDNNRVAIAWGYDNAAFTGTKTVTITCSGSSAAIAGAVYYVSNINSGTAQESKLSNVAVNSENIAWSTINRGGVIFGVFGTSGGTAYDSPTWGNMTIDAGLLVNTMSSIHGSGNAPTTPFNTTLYEPNLLDNTNRYLIMKGWR